MSHGIPGRPWESVRAYIFSINNKNYLCIVDYHSKFLAIKLVTGFSTYNLIKMCNIIFVEYGMLSKIVSVVGTNSVSENFQDFCKCLNIHHAITLSYTHHINGHVEACINFIKVVLKMLGN